MLDALAKMMELKGLRFQEANLVEFTGVEFWHSLVHDKDGLPVSAGFHSERMSARKVAIAEFLEREQYRNIARSDETLKQAWGLDLIPTACGFAAGFNRANTVTRSVAEACERWVMSKWIDEHFNIDCLQSEQVAGNLDAASTFFLSQFDRVDFYLKKLVVAVGEQFYQFDIAQTMGIKDGGIFPGSSAQVSADGNVWQHALLESYRHLLLVKNNNHSIDRFPENKIRFFAKNSDLAIAQINSATRTDWPTPSIRLMNCEEFEGGGYFVARTILDGWKSWSEGPIERFLY